MENNFIAVDICDQRQVKKQFIELLTTNSYKNIYIFAQNEMEYDLVFDEFVYPLLGHYIESKGLHVDIIMSLVKEKDNVKKYKGIDIHSWPTYWLYKTYGHFKSTSCYNERIKRKSESQGLKYHFITMNNRSHPFRCELIDKLAEHDLLKHSAYSWNNTDTFLNTYQFKYFDAKTKTFDDGFKTTGGQYYLPTEYFESFAQLISESDTNRLFFSEKISIALITGKPFIAAAGYKIHEYLRDSLGFKLFEEVFDYSFDNEPDRIKRWDMIVENMKNLCKLSHEQLKDLTHSIRPKIIYNQNRAREIVQDANFIPKPVHDCIKLYRESTERVHDKLIHVVQNLDDALTMNYIEEYI